MNALKRVVELNESAVISLHEGQVETSVLLLREALNTYRANLTGEDKEINHGPGNVAEPNDHVLGVALGPRLCKNDKRVTPDNIFSPFNCAFCFMEEIANVDSAAVVVLYNYGLALHRRGMQNGIQADLRRALQLYSMSFGLLQDDAMAGRFQLGRVGLALLANQAQLHHHFLESNQVQETLDQLQSMLANRSRMNLSPDEFCFFFHLGFFSSRSIHASPAA